MSKERNENKREEIFICCWFPRPLLTTVHFAHTVPYTVLLFLATLPKVRRKKLIVPRKLAIDLTFNTLSSAKWRLLKWNCYSLFFSLAQNHLMHHIVVLVCYIDLHTIRTHTGTRVRTHSTDSTRANICVYGACGEHVHTPQRERETWERDTVTHTYTCTANTLHLSKTFQSGSSVWGGYCAVRFSDCQLNVIRIIHLYPSICKFFSNNKNWRMLESN